MAPFCEHDCLHTHWRWGEFAVEQQNRGWSAPTSHPTLVPGRPYAIAGAPMVPHNQAVTISIPSLHEFEYRVHATGWFPATQDPIPAGTYTFVNHHGSAYALSVNAVLFQAAKVQVGLATEAALDPHVGSPALSSNSAILYWYLRFGGTQGALFIPDIVQERLKTTGAAGDAKIRDD
jgi:hypothetical protein